MLAAQHADAAFTDREIIGNALVLLFAGEDATAHSLGWTMWLLSERAGCPGAVGQGGEARSWAKMASPREHEAVAGLATARRC